MSTGQRIKEARENLALTQEELGQKIGVTGVTVMRYEKGQREPRFEQLQRIASALGVTVAYLQGYETKDASLVVAALKNKDYRELERLMGLPSDSIQPLDPDEEKKLRSQVDEEKRRKELNFNVTPDPEYINLEKKLKGGSITVEEFQQYKSLLIEATDNAHKAVSAAMERLQRYMDLLNAAGQVKVFDHASDYAKELTEIPKYQRQTPQGTPTTPSERKDTPQPENPSEGPQEGK